MRRKILIIFICLLSVFVFASCARRDNEKFDVNRPALSITGDVTDEGFFGYADETEKAVDLKGAQKTQTDKVEKVHEKDETVEADNADNTDNSENTDEDSGIKEDVFECILSVRCDVVFENISKLDEAKLSVLPQDGIIFPEGKVIFYDGESVFNVLTRELKKNRIHIDFVETPMYNTVYIRGISNLYEHDCGDLSGWIYKVNGQVPGRGCSQYILKDGDKIEFVYTCDSGKDNN